MLESKPSLIGIDLEGCLIPEIWIQLAETFQVEELKLTTRDIKDYDELMQKRLSNLEKHNIDLEKIQSVIARIEPLPGAKDFLDRIRKEVPLLILSDTFYEFIKPLVPKLGFPSIFCHNLVLHEGKITGYKLRNKDSKAKLVSSLQENGFQLICIGDSYNDITMLKKAEQAYFLHAPENVRSDFPDIPYCVNYTDLQKELNACFMKD